MRGGFLLDPEVAYFNHGGYGACPVEVFDEYQRLQRELEHEPTEFFTRRFGGSMRDARDALAAFVGVRTDDLVFAPKATSALNAVIRSLRIRPEVEVGQLRSLRPPGGAGGVEDHRGVVRHL